MALSSLLHSTIPYSSTLLYPTLLHSTIPHSTLLYSALLYCLSSPTYHPFPSVYQYPPSSLLSSSSFLPFPSHNLSISSLLSIRLLYEGKVVSRTRHGNSYKDKKEELISLGFNFNTQARGSKYAADRDITSCILHCNLLHCTALRCSIPHSTLLYCTVLRSAVLCRTDFIQLIWCDVT